LGLPRAGQYGLVVLSSGASHEAAAGVILGVVVFDVLPEISELSRIGHSLTDGIAIGLAVRVSTSVGLAVALAVVGHDFADGLNTVSLMLVQGHDRRRAAVMLLLDAMVSAPG
jgi:zinc transporter ZupT